VTVLSSEAERTASRRILARPTVIAAGIWVVFAANFVHLTAFAHTDAQLNYAFLRRLFGVHTAGTVAYQFGLAFAWLPAYLLGRAIEAIGATTIGGVPTPQAVIGIGSIVYVLATLLLAVVLLRRLRAPHPAAVALVAVLGSPLVFLGSFSPLRTEPVEAFLLTFSLLPLLAMFRSERHEPRLAIGAGALLGMAATVRWFNAAEAIAAVLCLMWFRRWRGAVWLAGSIAAVTGALVLVPVALGVPLFQSHGYGAGMLSFSPFTLPRMLFTDYRGLFVWTPVTILSVLGYIRLVLRRPADRQFLGTVAAMSLALAFSYEAYSAWDAGFSFSARYLTPLFPFFVLGLAGLVDWRPRLVWSAAAVATAWTLFLALNVGLPFGGYGIDTGNASQLAGRVLDGRMSPGRFITTVWHYSHLGQLIRRL
jgi:Dolichyl-phosphate-mannose-protein mannosyltransferase